LTPSVDLCCEIPESPSDSFFSGQIYVTIKDSVFDGSDAVRHVIELLDVLELEEKKPFLTLFTDGGSDHNITHLYVQCSLLALFLVGEYDILNAGRCCPYQSYTNPAERCMSLLNIGLQGVALERSDAGAFEKTIKSAKSMKGMRELNKKTQGMKQAYQSSIKTPIQIIEDSFSHLELKGKNIKIAKPNRDTSKIVAALKSIEPKIGTDEDIPRAMAKLPNFPSLKSYLEKHMKDGLYLIQFRKCDDLACCQRTIQDLPPHIPAPILSPDSNHYMKFNDLYGKIQTTEADCPSLNAATFSRSKKTSGFKYLASLVVSKIECSLCGKFRCVFSTNKMLKTDDQKLLEDLIYSCGALLDSSRLYASQALSCKSNIESSLYATKFGKPPPCFHCGSMEVDTKTLRELLQKYKSVYPACIKCKESGKKEEYLEKTKRQKAIKRPSSAPRIIEPASKVTKNQVNVTIKDKTPKSAKPDQTLIQIQDEPNEADQPSCSKTTNDTNRTKTKPLTAKGKQKKKKQSQIKFSAKASAEFDLTDNSVCKICHEEDDARATQKVPWIDCDICEDWAHQTCAERANWINLRRKSWICLKHSRMTQDQNNNVTEE
uniref:Zinc finger PHD-type domain-containing protein n=2 Tax=Clytia hemisphaerica TaxID=252671 RepID=A0A7M5VAL2_9CNID